MKLSETIELCAAIEALCPAQRMKENTPDLWQVALADVRYEDVMTVLPKVARSMDFISLHAISEAVKELREGRLARLTPPDPNVHPDEPGIADVLEQRALRRAIEDGAFTAQDKARYEAGELGSLTGARPYRLPGEVSGPPPAGFGRVLEPPSGWGKGGAA